MSKYSVRKIDPNAWLPCGGKCYSHVKEFTSARDLLSYIKNLDSNSTMWFGKGFDIYLDTAGITEDKLISHSSNYTQLAQSKVNISVKSLSAIHRDMVGYYAL